MRTSTKKGLAVCEKILDYMGRGELIATLSAFRKRRANSSARRYRVRPPPNQVHFIIGREVRATIERVGGRMPEDLLTSDKSIPQIEKEQLAALKEKAKKKPLVLDA